MPELWLPADRAADRSQPVSHIDVPVTPLGLVPVVTRAVVADREQQPARLLPQTNLDLGADGMFGGVLQGLQAAEVDGSFHLGRIAADAFGDDVHRERVAVSCRSQRLDKAPVDQQWWIDAVCELAQLLNRLLPPPGELLQHLRPWRRVVGDDVAGQT